MTTYYVVQLPNGKWIVRATTVKPMTAYIGPYTSRQEAQDKAAQRNAQRLK